MTPQDAERIVARSLFVMLRLHEEYGETPEESDAARAMKDRLLRNEPLTQIKLTFADQEGIKP